MRKTALVLASSAIALFMSGMGGAFAQTSPAPAQPNIMSQEPPAAPTTTKKKAAAKAKTQAQKAAPKPRMAPADGGGSMAPKAQ